MSESGGAQRRPLSALQHRVAEVFFSLPQAKGFVLAGGASLIVNRVVDRPTEDLDMFTSYGGGNVPAAADALQAACGEQGWTTQRLRDVPTFVRMTVTEGDQETLVDLAVDYDMTLPPVVTVVGPTLHPREAAGRKVLTVFDRTEPRDFVDLWRLVALYGKDDPLEYAAAADSGFDRGVLADMMGLLDRVPDEDLGLPGVAVAEVRAFYAQWVAELRERA